MTFGPTLGKSPGAAPVMREVLGIVEAHMARDYPDEMAAWKPPRWRS